MSGLDKWKGNTESEKYKVLKKWQDNPHAMMKKKNKYPTFKTPLLSDEYYFLKLFTIINMILY